MTTFTQNLGFVVDPTGSNVGTWATNVTNPDFVAIDGMVAGIQTISVSNVPVTLTAPAGFTATPSGGPTQAQNRVLRFTGVMTGNVVVTLPLPGQYTVENFCTSPAGFVLFFRGVTATEIIGVDFGDTVEIYNDGANVRFIGMGRTGSMELWAGLSAIPSWVTVCTRKPYLLCDGTIYQISDFPALGAKLGTLFGGNGITTFGVPDLRGRFPLAYDGTGGRITVAGCGLNGQSIGATLDQQSVTLTAAQIPSLNSGGLNTINVAVTTSGVPSAMSFSSQVNSGGSQQIVIPGGLTPATGILAAGNNNIAVVTTNTGGSSHPNVPPTQVTGIWVVRAA